jgi:hypothetical protein
VVHVLTYNREFVRDLTFDTMTTWRRALEHALKTTWAAPLRDRGLPHRCSVVEDESPAAGLIRVAEREGADLLVVGTRARHGLASRVRGSLSYALTHHAGCPVVVVPPAWAHPSVTPERTGSRSLVEASPRPRISWPNISSTH